MPKVLAAVTQTLIAEGKRNDCEECPVALASLIAVKRVRPEIDCVHASDDVIEFRTGHKIAFSVYTPMCAADFIYAFDAGEAVAPFKFSFKVPDA